MLSGKPAPAGFLGATGKPHGLYKCSQFLGQYLQREGCHITRKESRPRERNTLPIKHGMCQVLWAAVSPDNPQGPEFCMSLVSQLHGDQEHTVKSRWGESAWKHLEDFRAEKLLENSARAAPTCLVLDFCSECS